VKKDLAQKIVADFHGAESATQAQRDFEAQFQKSALPSDLASVVHNFVSPRKMFQLLVDLKLCATNSEAQRKIKEGAVSICAAQTDRPEWKRLNNPTEEFNASENPAVIFRVGRKLLRVNFETEK
jgi:tyrosyl-tRNA synthetase